MKLKNMLVTSYFDLIKFFSRFLHTYLFVILIKSYLLLLYRATYNLFIKIMIEYIVYKSIIFDNIIVTNLCLNNIIHFSFCLNKSKLK